MRINSSARAICPVTPRRRSPILSRAALGLVLLLLLSACGGERRTKYTHSFLGTFDTVIQVVGYAQDEASFEEMAQKAQTRFEALHRLYDLYHTYEGTPNLKTINDQAGIGPVTVAQELVDLVEFSLMWQSRAGNAVNIAMGPVLSLWHDARGEGTDHPESARLPEMAALREASAWTDPSLVEVNTATRTVYLPRAEMSLDLGAVAKGYACGIVAEELKAAGYSDFLISGGGNIVAVGAPRDGVRTKWGIAIQNPDANPMFPDEDPLDVAYVNDAAIVTSGDNQRAYLVDGKSYHHLIDPTTLMPATHYRSVTVMAADSGAADFLSSTLFLLPPEQSRAMARETGCEAMWVLPDGTVETTEGMRAVLRDRGGASNR
jgi:thiamine biosynthesis lipoprotein